MNIRRRTRSRKILSQRKTSASLSQNFRIVWLPSSWSSIFGLTYYLLFRTFVLLLFILIYIAYTAHCTVCTWYIKSLHSAAFLLYCIPNRRHQRFIANLGRSVFKVHTCISPPHDQLLYSLQILFSLLFDIVIRRFVVLSLHLMLFIAVIIITS